MNGTAFSEVTATTIGAILGGLLVVWIGYMILRAFQIQATERDKKRIKKGKKPVKQTPRRFIPIIIMLALLIGIMIFVALV